jgi:hypothetical protein
VKVLADVPQGEHSTRMLGMVARSLRTTDSLARQLLIAVVASALAACGGGGGSSGPSVVPETVGSQGLASTGTLPASIGTIATGYIECDTQAHTAAGNNCDGQANFTPATPPASGGFYTFTAIAAGAAGSPIDQQLSNGGALSFANGSYRVIESPSDGAAMVSISGGPWSMPGSAFTGASGSYGNQFSVTCTRVGTANLLLQTASNGKVGALAFGSSAFASNTTTVNCSATGSFTFE